MSLAARTRRLFSPAEGAGLLGRVIQKVEDARYERDVARLKAHLSWYPDETKGAKPGGRRRR